MGKILHLKWYAWVLFSLYFLRCFFFSIKFIYNYIGSSVSSPFIPKEAVYTEYIYAFVFISAITASWIGILLMLFRKKLGWILLCGFTLFYILYHLPRCSGGDPGLILLLALEISILVLAFTKPVEGALNIKWRDIVSILLIALLFYGAYYFMFALGGILAIWF